MKKLLILPAAVMVVGQVALMPLEVCAKEITSVNANELMTDFVFSEIGAASGKLSFWFNDTQRRDIRLEEVYVASYKYEEYTMSEVESRLGELGTDMVTDPEWAGLVVVSVAPIDYGTWSTRTLFTSSWPDFLNNRPGILYYALRMYEVDNPDEPVWYRGKVDYRACMRDAENGAIYDCKGEMGPGRTEMVFTRSNGEAIDYDGVKSWGEEWQEEMDGRLEVILGEIDDWDGDEWAREDWAARLRNIERLAADAKDTSAVSQKISVVEEAIEKKAWDLEHPKEEAEEPVESGGMGSGGSSLVVSGSNSSLGDVAVGAEIKDDEPEVELVAVVSQAVNSASVVTEMETGGNAQVARADAGDTDEGMEPENDEEQDDEGQINLNIYDEIEVPNLNNKEAEDGKWWIWWLIILVLMLGGATYWWVRRAFGGKHK